MTAVSEPASPRITGAGLGGRPPLAGTRRLGGFCAARVGQAALTLLIASAAVWVLSAAAPGSPAQQVLSAHGIRNPSLAQVQAEQHALGLDQPAVVRYLHWLGGALHGNLGTSYISGRPVLTELTSRLGATLILTLTALVIVIAVALVIGLGAAATAGRWPDLGLRCLTVLAAAVPPFLTGLFIIQFIIIRYGIGDVITNGTFSEVWFPAAAIAIGSLAVPARMLRASAITSLTQAYSTVASARGGTRSWILLRHALPNSLVPFINTLALSAAWMISGTVVVETVFSWPGVGSYLVQAVQQQDLPVVDAGVMLATFAYLAAGFAADLLALLIDPRLQEAAA